MRESHSGLWDVGNAESPEFHRSFPLANPAVWKIQRWVIICGTPKRMILVKTRLYSNCLISSSKPKKLGTTNYSQVDQHWTFVLRDSGKICGIPGIWRFRHPTAHCGITVYRLKSLGTPVALLSSSDMTIMRYVHSPTGPWQNQYSERDTHSVHYSHVTHSGWEEICPSGQE
jgi:hypothetical protein